MDEDTKETQLGGNWNADHDSRNEHRDANALADRPKKTYKMGEVAEDCKPGKPVKDMPK